MEQAYKLLLTKILREGKLRPNRTDTKAYSMFALNLDFYVHTHMPLLNGKLIDFRIAEAEFEWFMKGQTDTKIFSDRKIKIWDAWADGNGYLGPVYGYQMLNFNGQQCNQLDKLLEGLRVDPFGRRHIVTLWNPLQLSEMALPPCYLYFQFYVDGNNLNLFVVQRSGDMFGGVPYDCLVFSQFLIYIAYKMALQPNRIALKIVDAHLYEDHVNGVYEYLNRPYINGHPSYKYDGNKFEIIGYMPQPKIKINIAK